MFHDIYNTLKRQFTVYLSQYITIQINVSLRSCERLTNPFLDKGCSRFNRPEEFRLRICFPEFRTCSNNAPHHTVILIILVPLPLVQSETHPFI